MTETKYIDDDIVKVYKFGKARKKENLLATLFWGDDVTMDSLFLPVHFGIENSNK